MKKVNSTSARPSTLQECILFVDKFRLMKPSHCSTFAQGLQAGGKRSTFGDIENIMPKSEMQSTRAGQRHQEAAYALFISVMLQSGIYR